MRIDATGERTTTPAESATLSTAARTSAGPAAWVIAMPAEPIATIDGSELDHTIVRPRTGRPLASNAYAANRTVSPISNVPESGLMIKKATGCGLVASLQAANATESAKSHERTDPMAFVSAGRPPGRQAEWCCAGATF